MTHRHEEGICHICGKSGSLSFEHIPPRSVGNTQRSRAYSLVEIAEKTGRLDATYRDGIQYKQQQQGSGFSSICSDCNSYLGRHYVNEYKDFYLATAELFMAEPPEDGVKGMHLETDKTNVLALFKHVISNFCATTQPGTMLDCKDFLLDRESNAFPNHYRLYMFAVPNPKSKMVTTGWSTLLMRQDMAAYCTVAYVAMFPVGFALVDLAKSSQILPDLGCDITSMASRPWGEKPRFAVELPFMKLDQGFPAPV